MMKLKAKYPFFSTPKQYGLRQLVLFSLLVLLISSCKVYSPQSVPIPLFTEKNEVLLTGGINIPAGIAGSLAYSPFSHVCIQAYGYTSAEETYYFQGSTGFFWKNNSSTRYEFMGGYASGKGKRIKSENPSYLEGEYDIYFTQFNLGQSVNRKQNIEYGFGLKAGLFNVSINDYGFYESNGLDPVSYFNKYFLLEPVALVRTGKRKIKSGVYISGTSLINLKPEQRLFPFHNLSIGFSLQYKFSLQRKNN